MKSRRIGNLDWIYLGEEGNKEKYLLKDVLDNERIAKYADDEFMYNGHDVRHQDTIRPFDWNKSYIKNTILPAFKKDLNVDYELDLLSIDEIRELPDEIRECNDWYWTKTPHSDSTNSVWYVHTYGYVDYASANGTSYGVRPVIKLEKSDVCE